MLTPNFGGTEPGYMALGIVDTLLDLMIERGVFSREDITGLLISAADRLSKENNFMGNRAAQAIRDGMPK
jgi:hypothetical protein